VSGGAGVGRERLYYMSQVGVKPPEFVVFTNLPSNRIHFSFRRYVANVIREEFGFSGTPIKLHFKESGEEK
jgi:GTP-binding protein